MMPEPNALLPAAIARRPETVALREQVEKVMNRHVTPTLCQVADQAEAAVQDAGDEMRMQAQRLTAAVQEKPLTSIGLAALAGFVMARLMGR